MGIAEKDQEMVQRLRDLYVEAGGGSSFSAFLRRLELESDVPGTDDYNLNLMVALGEAVGMPVAGVAEIRRWTSGSLSDNRFDSVMKQLIDGVQVRE